MLLYRPDPRISCCPHYTIRLEVNAFQPSRDHRSTINRFNKFVTGEQYIKDSARLHPKTRAEAQKRQNEFVFTARLHEAEASRLKSPPTPDHQFKVTLESNEFTEQKYTVWANYQQMVHHDPPSKLSRGSFRGFLCESPVRPSILKTPEGERPLGSFHQCYWLDGRLVAVGVVDLLPDCVSAVYFFYHESIHKYAPGKLGALHEISLAKELGYRWWYPGFYIHGCPKMRYKIGFQPQSILDPESLSWDPLDQEVLGLLDKHQYLSLSAHRQAGTDSKDSVSPEPHANDAFSGQSLFEANMPGIPEIGELDQVDLDHIRVMTNRGVFETKDLVHWNADPSRGSFSIRSLITELVAALGTDCTDSLCVDFRRKR